MAYYVGEIRAFGDGELPSDFLPCDGREVNIGSYLPLFSLLGATYGGDGVTKFALPDLRGRVVAGAAPADGQPSDQASGRDGKDPDAIPWTAVRWGIAVAGIFPLRD
jgi:microcystin-dependent protein